MDPITHTLTGATLGQAGLKRGTALAWPALLIGANLPDLDGLAYLVGNLEALAFRRGWTHGVLAMVLLPLLLTGLLLAWDRLVRQPLARRRGLEPGTDADPRGGGTPSAADSTSTLPARLLPPVRPARLLLVSSVAVWSHPLLDWLNTYGIRWLMPFSDRWFYGDTLFIVDPWVWLALLAGIWLARARGPAPARWALGAFALYGALMWTGSTAARAQVADTLEQQEGARPDRVLAAPVPLNPTARSLLVEASDRYRRGSLRWGEPPRLEPPEEGVPRGEELRAEALRHREGRLYLVWSRFPVFERVPEGVRIRDMRYLRNWVAVVVPAEATGRPE